MNAGAAPVTARTYPLAIGALAAGTSGYVMSGLLPAVTAGLGTSTALTGQLGTVFAFAGGVTAVAGAVVTGRCDRRRLLVGALVLAAIGNVACAVAPSFPLLLAARVITSVGASTFTPNAFGVATALNDAHHRARAAAVVAGGLTLAMVLGVPAANAIGASVGFRAVFGLIAGMCLLGAGSVRMFVPSVPAAPVDGGDVSRAELVRDGRTLHVLALTLVASASVGVGYTYLAPVLAARFDAGPAAVSFVLVGYGLGGVVGNVAGGRVSDRFGSRRTVLVATGAGALLLTALALFSGTLIAAAVLVALWGATFWALNPPLASWMVELNPARSALLLPLSGAALYFGNGVGCLLGGVVIPEFGLGAVVPTAALLVALACVGAATARAHPRAARLVLPATHIGPQ